MRNDVLYLRVLGYTTPLLHHYCRLLQVLILVVSFLNDYLALSKISTNLQFFVFDKGRHSRIRTVSPMLQSFFSSWATNLVDFLINLPYFKWFTLRSTVITIDLSIKSLVTTPVLSFLKC